MTVLLTLLVLAEMLVACRMWITLLVLQERHRKLSVRLLAVENRVKSPRKEQA